MRPSPMIWLHVELDKPPVLHCDRWNPVSDPPGFDFPQSPPLNRVLICFQVDVKGLFAPNANTASLLQQNRRSNRIRFCLFFPADKQKRAKKPKKTATQTKGIPSPFIVFHISFATLILTSLGPPVSTIVQFNGNPDNQPWSFCLFNLI
jgi:hypothetical protein